VFQINVINNLNDNTMAVDTSVVRYKPLNIAVVSEFILVSTGMASSRKDPAGPMALQM
jgi:hypothetical protein